MLSLKIILITNCNIIILKIDGLGRKDSNINDISMIMKHILNKIQIFFQMYLSRQFKVKCSKILSSGKKFDSFYFKEE